MERPGEDGMSQDNETSMVRRIIRKIEISPSSEWTELRKEIARRLREPAGRVAFVMYFFAVVLALGGMGWLIPLYRFYFLHETTVVSELPSAYSTFFLALLASALADIVLVDDEPNDISVTPTFTKGFKMFALGLSLLGIPLAYAGIQRHDLNTASVASVSGMAMSLFLWWILNADRSRWREKPTEAISAAGGPTSVELKGSTQGLVA